jgi:hypothetical protein
MNTKQFIQLLEQEVEDFVQTQAEKIVSFEDDPMAYILQKYPSLKATLEDLMTSNFEDYITGIYVMAPKPTTFKVLLHNGQHFFLIYARDSYIAKIAGKKYYLLNIGEQEYAIKSISDLLTMGMPPGAEGPDEEVDNDSSAGSDDTPDDTSADDTGGDDEELAEVKEETKEEKPKRKTPLKFKILKESVEKKKSPLKFKILKELERKSYDILTPEAQKIAQEIIKDFGIEKSQIQPNTRNNVVIYDDTREVVIKKLEDDGRYGTPSGRSNNIFKVGNVNIILKPDKTSGEYYDLKPQKLGLTLDQKISLSDSKQELIKGIDANSKISEEQKKVIKYLASNQNKPTEEEIKTAFDDKYFFREFFKNLGEVLGAYNYGESIGADTAFFPGKGNYPLIDYILYKGEEPIKVSAKSSKSAGNTVKLQSLENIVKNSGGEIDKDLQEIIDIVNNNSVVTGAFELIDKFGSSTLKQKKEEYLKEFPLYPSIDKDGYDVDAHQKRTVLEREILKELNQKYNFSDLFNQYVAVKYVKYDVTIPGLEEKSKVIESGQFKTSLKSKNSPRHDTDKIGLDIKQIKSSN